MSPVCNQPSTRVSAVAAWVLVVAGEEHVATHQDLAVIRDAQLHPWNDLSDRSEARMTTPVHCGHGHVLAHPVPLEDLEPECVEEAQHLHGYRRRPGDERVRLVETGLGADAAEHETLGHQVANPLRGRRRPASLTLIDTLFSHGDRPPRQAAGVTQAVHRLRH